MRYRRHRLARLVRLRPDEVEFPVRLVLRHDEGKNGFAGLAELEHTARKDRVLQLDCGQPIPDRCRVERARLLDRGNQGAYGLIRTGVIPLRSFAGGGLPFSVERLHLRVWQEVGPPSPGEDVVPRGAETPPPRLVRPPSPV